MNDQVEQKGLDSLQPADYNPRTISDYEFKALKRSMAEFGDLSGVIKNVTTGNLVGGHQRVKAFQQAKSAKVVVTSRLDKPNRVGTVARGYIEIAGIDSEHFSYREVEWPLEREQTANVAANKIQGVFDFGKLAKLIDELDPDLRELTGHTQDEIDKLLTLVGQVSPASSDDQGQLGEMGKDVTCPSCGHDFKA